MPEVEGGYGFGTHALRDGNDRRIDQPKAEGTLSSADALGCFEILIPFPFDRECPLGEIREKRSLRSAAEMGRHKVVDFRKDRPREDPAVCMLLVQSLQGRVVILAGVQQRDHRAGIDNDHRSSPKPESSASARCLRSRRPLLNAPMLRGLRLGA